MWKLNSMLMTILLVLSHLFYEICSDLSSDSTGDSLITRGNHPDLSTRHHHRQGWNRTDHVASYVRSSTISHHASSLHRQGESFNAKIENVNLRRPIVVRSKQGMHACEQGTCKFVDCPHPTHTWCTDADTFFGNSANSEFDICFKEDPFTSSGMRGLHCSKTLQFGWSDAGLSNCRDNESLSVDGLCCLDCYFKQFNRYPARKVIDKKEVGLQP